MIKKFRRIKEEIRILGIDDAPFKPFKKSQVLVVGTIFRGNKALDGVLSTHVEVDGEDATKKLVEMINNTRHKDQLGVVMLDGITFAGFNIVDIEKLFNKTKIPVIVIIKKFPNRNKIKEALKKHFKDWKERWKKVLNAGKIYKVENLDLYIQIKGLKLKDAIKIVKLSIKYGITPEPIRVAHLIASGIEKGESRGKV